MRLALVLLLLCTALPAGAQSLEQTYFALRDQAAGNLRWQAQQPGNNPAQAIGKPEYFSPSFRAEYDRQARVVERRLREVLGPTGGLRGFPGGGTLNPALCCYGRMGALDGLLFEAPNGSRLIVSDEGLLRRWLQENKDFWPAGTQPPSDLSLLFRNANFYQWSRATDWPVLEYSGLPIGLPTDGVAIGAFLGSAGPGSWPDWVGLSVAKGPRVYVAFFHPKTPIRPIALCESIGQKTLEAYRECWNQGTPQQSWYSRLLLEVSAVAEDLPTR
ncbi:MAG TPA: hypothetical protein VMI56_12025 [Reyranella sp.]|nr:hypothetical protein [Reyranella sp.]